MQLLLLAENWPPRVGGIENYLTRLAKALPDGTVDVVAPAPTASSDADGVIRRRFFWPIVKPAWLPLFMGLWRHCRTDRPDVVLCGKALFEGQVGYYLKKFLGIPYVVFTYAMEIETWREDSATRTALARVLTHADRVVYINEKTKKVLGELGVAEATLLKLTPGVDERYLREVPDVRLADLRKRYSLPQRYVLCVARLIERKGIDVLMEAFGNLDQTKFNDVHLVIVGDGPADEDLADLAEKLWINTSTVFLGEVPDGDLPGLYAGADVFALTPRRVGHDYEGFGIVYLEAAASGVPAIGTASGGVPEAIVHDSTGLVVPPDDPAAVTEALTRLLSDSSLRDRFGRAAHERVQRDFLWPQRGNMLSNVIADLTRSTRRSA